ncbi:MAG: LLM class F420-dependent oxidoreductase [Pseudomonadota bacterium]
MDAGIHVVNFTLAGGGPSIGRTVGDLALAAESCGMKHLSLMDHFFQLDFLGGGELDMLEAYTTMGFIAAKTETIPLGVLVSGVTYRHPGLLAKIITTLDILSGGRAELGIGAAWYDREHHGLGVPFPPLAERFERLEETLQICLQMWSDDNGSFRGKHYQLAETRNVPQSIQRPHPPILIGGGGERKTLKLVAKYASACNFFSREGVDTCRHKLDVLNEHCLAVGREFDQITKTVLYTAPMPDAADRDGFLDEMQAFREIGIDMVFVMPFSPDPMAELERFAPLVVELNTL